VLDEGIVSMRTYVYVDGESHFIRSDASWKKLRGQEAELEDIIHHLESAESANYPDSNKPLIRLERRGKFFWDTYYPLLIGRPFHQTYIDGAVYYTDFSGNDPEMHEVRVFIRKQGFDPQVVGERGQLARHRENRLKNEGILEKPKGVDIGLTVRLLEDAYRHIFDICYLFTSDVDYIPVIQAIQRIGRKVVVFGYRDGLGGNSDLEYVPDGFIELGEYMKSYHFRS
jgi:uncharacterized LabA/DUF88 family protein